MSDGSLSQDEIDALLQGTDTIEMDTGAGSASALTEAEKSALQEMLRGVTESQGSNLSILMGKTVAIGDPTVKARTPAEIAGGQPEDVVDVRVDLTEGLQGEHSYIVPRDTAAMIAGLMMGQPGGDLDEASLSAVSEAMSQITGTAATAIGNQVGRMVKTAPPDLREAKRQQVRIPQGDFAVTVDYPLSIEGMPTTTLTEVFSLSLAKEILSLAQGGADRGQSAAPQAGARTAAPRAASQAAAQQAAAAQFGAPAGFQQTFGQAFGIPSAGPTMAPPNVQPVQFANLQPAQMGGEQGNIGLLMDVYMEMTVELGRTRKRIKDILGIGEGTIIELDKLAGEAVDILVNHKLIAKGEVVVIDENFGVRVTEIVSQIDRMNELT